MAEAIPSGVDSRGPALLRIELIRVKNFRGINDCVLTLEPGITLLVGRNSAGKSRLLRAIAIACSAQQANADDFTVDDGTEPEIDLVLAPPTGADEFDDRIQTAFGNQVQPTSPAGRERVAWRTTINRSEEGWGGRAESRFLTYDAGSSDWTLGSSAASVSSGQKRLVAADYVDTGRDLASEMNRTGSAIRRVLDKLEVPESERKALETDLSKLGDRIVDNSAALAHVRKQLGVLSTTVAGVGTPDVRALPRRLEELVRMIDVGLDNGHGALPMRMHGSGARSLASLQVQSVLYDRRLGRDGTDLPTHPVSLIEEPEAHLHPQACFQLQDLLERVPGQVIVSTHSSHLVTVAPVGSLRLVRSLGKHTSVQDFTPVDSEKTTPAALRVDVARLEWEKIRKYVERPFGEVLFASVIVIGDGASERGFLPEIVRHSLGVNAAGVCVVDPQAASQAPAMVKFAEAAGIPCIAFMDSDKQGRADNRQIPPYAIRVWSSGDQETDGAIEEVLHDFDPDLVAKVCDDLLPATEDDALTRLKKLKGTYGAPMGRAFVDKHPDVSTWPAGFKQIVDEIRGAHNHTGSTDA